MKSDVKAEVEASGAVFCELAQHLGDAQAYEGCLLENAISTLLVPDVHTNREGWLPPILVQPVA